MYTQILNCTAGHIHVLEFVLTWASENRNIISTGRKSVKLLNEEKINENKSYGLDQKYC